MAPGGSDELHYVSVDGSMYFTREEGRKGTKLGRIYKHDDLMEVSKGRCELQGPTHVAHLGSSRDLLPKMEYHIENIRDRVFVSDGARWIWNWVEGAYPDSVQVVELFHAKEHPCEFARGHFKGQQQRERWVALQSETMLERGISP